MQYAFIDKHSGEFRTCIMGRVLEVARSGYDAWKARGKGPSKRQAQRARVDERGKGAFEKRKSFYGAPRLAHDFEESGDPLNRKTVAASLRRQDLRAKAARKFKATTNSKHGLPMAPNLLAQDFTTSAPNQKWVSDITYLGTEEGGLYLAVIIDLFSRMVVGGAIDERMTAKLACDALQRTLWQRGMPRGIIVPSDRGSPYCSAQYQALLTRRKLVCSMSGKGNCFDNACAESFFHSLKVEAIHGKRFQTREAMRRTVFEYIAVNYHRMRRHSSVAYLSPESFEAKFAA